MEDHWDYKASFLFKTKAFAWAVFAWVAFNALTGLFTGNYALVDNYFFLVVFLLVAAFKSSYRVTYKNGMVATYQLGMVTNSINLYETTNVEIGKKRITIHYPGDTRFVIKCWRLPKKHHQLIISSIKALEGKRPENAQSPIAVVELKHEAESVGRMISGGLLGLGIGIVALFTGTLYLPRGEILSASDPGNTFVYYVTACLVGGAIFVVYGLLRKRSMPNK